MSPLPRKFSSSVGDCDIGDYFDSLTNSILSTSHSMCSAETQPRVQSPTYPMKRSGREEEKTTKNNDREGLPPKQNNTQTLTALAPTPKRPPLPTDNRTTLQERKKPGLSLTIPQSPDDVQEMPPTCPVSLQRHVELKKKLSSSHFLFRPVSEDSQSTASAMNKKSSNVKRAQF